MEQVDEAWVEEMHPCFSRLPARCSLLLRRLESTVPVIQPFTFGVDA